MLNPDISALKPDMSALKPEISKRKLDISILLLVYVATLIALGTLGVATKANVLLAKKANVQTTTSSEVKIEGLTTSPDGPAAQAQSK